MPIVAPDGARGVTPALDELGWTLRRERDFAVHTAAGLVPGRVVSEARGGARAQTHDGVLDVVVQRGFRRSAGGGADYPAVGDWLALEPMDDPSTAALRAILPRTGTFSRGQSGAARPDSHISEQVVAANVDTVLLVAALTGDYNVRRMERYLALAWSSGADPVVLLNKADLCPDVDVRIREVAAIAGDVPIHALSARTGEGLDVLWRYVVPGATVALLGSSGVGKSTITNALLGEERQLVREVRADDDRGRHTTSGRELFVLPRGGALIDTPGMRSIGMWDVGEGLDRAFADIEALAAACRFSDCAHGAEPGCAVQAAIASGNLPGQRLASRRKLEREARSAERRASAAGSRAEQRQFARMVRQVTRTRARMRGQEG
jgi:ribosome biogenesis GTPase / thiamine phosphate phosphatase